MKEIKVKCDYCSNDAKLVGGDVIYPHRPDLREKNFWNCEPCKAYVGCHGVNPKRKLTGIEPLGRLANAELRSCKQKAHAAFDPLWKHNGPITRRSAYEQLAAKLKIKTKECHIGMFDIETCKKVIGISAQLKKEWL